MNAEDHLRQGNLADCLEALQNEVRAAPTDAEKRTFLFQLLSVMGDWPRALTQLSLAGELDPSALAMVSVYRPAVDCEVFREDVFAGKRTPPILGEPDQWLAELMESLRAFSAGEKDQADEMRAKAFDSAPEVSGTGTIGDNAVTFSWIADGDSRLGPVLEAVVGGEYYWVPFSRVREIEIQPPEDLRDVVWLPATVTWSNDGKAPVLIPVRYAGSTGSSDDALRLSRRTEWIDHGGDVYTGLGQRMLYTDAGEFPLLDVRKIVLDVERPELEAGD